MTEAIRRQPFITFFVVCILVNVAIVALPCETFSVKFTNIEREPVFVRIALDDINRPPGRDVIWSGTVAGEATEFVSISETLRGDGFAYQFYYPAADRVKWSNEGWAAFSFLPKLGGPFDVRLSLRGSEDKTSYKHPVINAFDSEFWQFFATLGVWYYRSVTCLDCALRRGLRHEPV